MTHPSEFVRIDEQLRLLQFQLCEFKNQFLTDSILQEICEHEKVVTGFRNALNMFGCYIFETEILSEGEAIASWGSSKTGTQSVGANFFQEFTSMTSEMFRKLISSILDKRNTEKIFRRFLIVLFDDYINAGNKYFSIESEAEKEQIMHEIIKRINC